jgi:MinD-like ATPase involved in chromosome partitioning or flagellar assembly
MGAAAAAEQVWLRAASLRPGCALVAISSADGGVGRSTLTAALGALLALACPEPVIAVDMSNRAWGGLAARVGRGNAGSVWDTVRDVDTLTSRAQVQRWAQHGPTGLQALIGEVEMAGKRRPPTHSESMTVVKALHPLYPLAVLDLAVAEIRGVWITLAGAAAPVLVSRATTDSLQHTMRLLAQMRAVGLTELADNALLVVMATSQSTRREVTAVARQAAAVAGGLLTVPYDPDLAQPTPIDPRRLRRATRRALVAVAAAVLARCPAEPAPAPPHEPSTRGAPDPKERA